MSDEHGEMREQLSAYIDGMLEGEERTRLEAWLDADPAARAELDALRRVDAQFRGLPRVSAPDDFEQRLRARITAPRLWPLLAAAAVLLMVAGVLVPTLVPKPNDEIQVARELPKAEPPHAPAGLEQVFHLEAAPAQEPVATSGLENAAEPARTPDLDAGGPPAASRSLTRETAISSQAEPPPPAPVMAPPAPEPAPAEARDETATHVEALGYLAGRPAPPPIVVDESASADGVAPVLPAPVPRAMPSVSDAPEKVAGNTAPGRAEAGQRRQLGSGRAGRGFGGFADRSEEPPRHEERRVAGRLFRLRDGVWIQRGYGSQPLTRLERGSADLEAVTEAHPDVRDFLTLEPRAVFRAGDGWYSVVPPGSARLESLGYLE